jgi:hypothetical protein
VESIRASTLVSGSRNASQGRSDYAISWLKEIRVRNVIGETIMIEIALGCSEMKA